MNVDGKEKVKLVPLSRDDILRGFILIISIFLIFFAFSSNDRTTGIFALLISTIFLILLFIKGPISVEPNYLFERYADNIGFYLDNAETYLCKSFDAKKRSEKVLVGVAFNFLLVMLFVLPIDLLFQHLTRGENSLLLYQQFLTWILYVIQSSLGIEVYIRGENSTILAYADIIDMEIVAECSGLHETVFLSLLVLCFRGVKPMVRAKWAIYAAVFIFVENLIRILSGYYLINIYDFSTWDKFHYFWWHTGQYALIMGVFVLWVMTIAGKPENKSVKKNYTR